MAREMTLADLEDSGVTFEPWSALENRSRESLISQRVSRGFVDRETTALFERHYDRAQVLNDLATNASRYRAHHGLNRIRYR